MLVELIIHNLAIAIIHLLLTIFNSSTDLHTNINYSTLIISISSYSKYMYSFTVQINKLFKHCIIHYLKTSRNLLEFVQEIPCFIVFYLNMYTFTFQTDGHKPYIIQWHYRPKKTLTWLLRNTSTM